MSEQRKSIILPSKQEFPFQILPAELYLNDFTKHYESNQWYMPPLSEETPWGDPLDEFNRNLITINGRSKLDVLRILTTCPNGSENNLMEQLSDAADGQVKAYFENTLKKEFFDTHDGLKEIFEKYCCQYFTYFLNHFFTFLLEDINLTASDSAGTKANFRIQDGKLYADVFYSELNLKNTKGGHEEFRLPSKTIVTFKFHKDKGIQLKGISTDNRIIANAVKTGEFLFLESKKQALEQFGILTADFNDLLLNVFLNKNNQTSSDTIKNVVENKLKDIAEQINNSIDISSFIKDNKELLEKYTDAYLNFVGESSCLAQLKIKRQILFKAYHRLITNFGEWLRQKAGAGIHINGFVFITEKDDETFTENLTTYFTDFVKHTLLVINSDGKLNQTSKTWLDENGFKPESGNYDKIDGFYGTGKDYCRSHAEIEVEQNRKTIYAANIPSPEAFISELDCSDNVKRCLTYLLFQGGVVNKLASLQSAFLRNINGGMYIFSMSKGRNYSIRVINSNQFEFTLIANTKSPRTLEGEEEASFPFLAEISLRVDCSNSKSPKIETFFKIVTSSFKGKLFPKALKKQNFANIDLLSQYGLLVAEFLQVPRVYIDRFVTQVKQDGYEDFGALDWFDSAKFENDITNLKVKSLFQDIYSKKDVTANDWIELANKLIVLAICKLAEIATVEDELRFSALLKLGFKLHDSILHTQKIIAPEEVDNIKPTVKYIAKEFWNIAEGFGLDSTQRLKRNGFFGEKIISIAERKKIDEPTEEAPHLLKWIATELIKPSKAKNKKVENKNHTYEVHIQKLVEQYNKICEYNSENNNLKASDEVIVGAISTLNKFFDFLNKNSDIKPSISELSILYRYKTILENVNNHQEVNSDSSVFQKYYKNNSKRLYDKFSLNDLLMLAPCKEVVLPALSLSKYSKDIVALVKNRNNIQNSGFAIASSEAFKNLLSSQIPITADKHLSTCLREAILGNKQVLKNLSSGDIVALVKDDNLATRKVLETGVFSTLFKTDILNKLSSKDLKELLIAQPDIAPLVFEPKKTFFGLITYLNVANRLTEEDLFSVAVSNKEVDITLLEKSKQLAKLGNYVKNDETKINKLFEVNFEFFYKIFTTFKFDNKDKIFEKYSELVSLIDEKKLDEKASLTDETKGLLRTLLQTKSLSAVMRNKCRKIADTYRVSLESDVESESSESESDETLKSDREEIDNSVIEIETPTSTPVSTPIKRKNAKDKQKEEPDAPPVEHKSEVSGQSFSNPIAPKVK